MPRLLQIDTCLNMSSTGHITESIGSYMKSKHWDCSIIHGARYVHHPSCMISYQTVNKCQEYLEYAKGLLFDNHGLGTKKQTIDAIKFIEKTAPDIIHIHNLHGYYINYKLLFDYLNGTSIPIVWTFHDCWPITGHCSHFFSIACDKWMKGCHDCKLIGNYPRALVDNSDYNYNLKSILFTSNKNLHIITVSKWLESILKQSFFSDYEINTIYNGIDTNVFYPQKNNSSLKNKYNPSGGKVLLAVATAWGPEKGLNDYISLSKLLPANYKIILVGVTDSIKKNLPDSITGIARTESAEELAGLYSLADIVLSLSYQETFGLTVVEGMACGTPGIVYNCTASPEIITETTGRVVKPGDLNDVLNAIMDITSKKKEYYSYECRKRVLEHFTDKTQLQSYFDLYNSLL